MTQSAITQTIRLGIDIAAQRSRTVARGALWRKLRSTERAMWELVFLQRHGAGTLAVDVGAHIGVMSSILARNFERVVAVEPHPAALRRLLWTSPANVLVLGAALGAVPGDADLLTPRRYGRLIIARSTLLPPPEGERHPRVAPVVVVTLDGVGLPTLDLMKIDVEGFELEVLQGGAETIARHRPIILVESEERHRPGAPAAVRRAMAAHGLTGFFVHGGRVHDAADFEPSAHQGSAPPTEDTVISGYANNFLYVRSEQASRWRARLETAVRVTSA